LSAPARGTARRLVLQRSGVNHGGGNDEGTLGFQAEVKQLLHLMIHSLYGNKEIFLRSWSPTPPTRRTSCASRRCRTTPCTAATPTSRSESPSTSRRAPSPFGQRHRDVARRGGAEHRTIAKSGTREFFQSLTGDQAKDARLIGQFGVGFYSSFIVADRVMLLTRRAGLDAGQAVRWSPTARAS